MKVRIIPHRARTGTMQKVFEELLKKLTGEECTVQIIQYVDNELDVQVTDKDGKDMFPEEPGS